jgi:hypothetical protein
LKSAAKIEEQGTISNKKRECFPVFLSLVEAASNWYGILI